MEEMEKRGPGRPRKDGPLPVKLLRGYFPKDGGTKIPAGTEVELPADEARVLVKNGVAVRNDEF